MKINVTGELSQEDINLCVKYCLKKYKAKETAVESIDLVVDENDHDHVSVAINYWERGE